MDIVHEAETGIHYEVSRNEMVAGMRIRFCLGRRHCEISLKEARTPNPAMETEPHYSHLGLLLGQGG